MATAIARRPTSRKKRKLVEAAVPELLLLPSDLDGLYTGQAVVWDDSGAERRATERLVLVE
jgi:hypothetical protein